MTWLRSKRQPDAELARARTDGERQHAGNADQGNGKSDGRKDTEHHGVETIRSENFGANVFEGSGAFNGFVVNIGSDANDAVRRGANPGDEFHHGITPTAVSIEGTLLR